MEKIRNSCLSLSLPCMSLVCPYLQKTQEVIAASLLELLYIVRLRSGRKYLQDADLHGALQYFLESKDINIRGLSFLIMCNMAKWDATLQNINLSFCTSDVKLFLATYMAYKSEAEVMGDFLARTNFPELCVQEFRNYVTRDQENEVLQVGGGECNAKSFLCCRCGTLELKKTVTRSGLAEESL